jgi:DNA processing protein
LQQPDKNKTNVLTGAADLIYILNWDIQKESKPAQKQLFVSLDDDEQVITSKTEKKLMDIILCAVISIYKSQECC